MLASKRCVLLFKGEHPRKRKNLKFVSVNQIYNIQIYFQFNSPSKMSNIFWSFIILSAALAVTLSKKEDVPELKLVNRRLLKVHPHPTSCTELGKCCQGKDNSCRIKTLVKKSGEVQAEDNRPLPQNATTCFCDSACLTLDDCCPDYQDFCKR